MRIIAHEPDEYGNIRAIVVDDKNNVVGYNTYEADDPNIPPIEPAPEDGVLRRFWNWVTG